jgi:hypothetical protein
MEINFVKEALYKTLRKRKRQLSMLQIARVFIRLRSNIQQDNGG